MNELGYAVHRWHATLAIVHNISYRLELFCSTTHFITTRACVGRRERALTSTFHWTGSTFS
jgi:hypothetical protein